MKKRILMLAAVFALAAGMLGGCGNNSQSASGSVNESISDVSAQSEADTDNQEADAKDGQDTSEAAAEPVVLEDGVYPVKFNTDSSMFHANEAYDGCGTLTVQNGTMTLHVSLASKHIVNLFVGTAADAQKDGAQILQPTTDTVTYSDGYTEEVYGFDVPVEAVNQKFDLALLGTKGTWYDHKVSVSDPVKAE